MAGCLRKIKFCFEWISVQVGADMHECMHLYMNACMYTQMDVCKKRKLDITNKQRRTHPTALGKIMYHHCNF